MDDTHSESDQIKKSVNPENEKSIEKIDDTVFYDAEEILDGIIEDPDVKEKVALVIRKVRESPHPSPRDFEGYKSVNPKLADDIFQFGKDEQLHRHKINLKSLELDEKRLDAGIRLEEKIIDNDNNETLRGQIFALIIVIMVVVLGAIMIFNDHAIGGTIFVGVGLALLVAQFIQGRDKPNKLNKTEDENI
ncbi:DUF2335 domain-containing protein [Saprospiraceae bacterium]|nr:DUF2335 domain-containing protein [Saprospiraceae bacterium]